MTDGKRPKGPGSPGGFGGPAEKPHPGGVRQAGWEIPVGEEQIRRETPPPGGL